MDEKELQEFSLDDIIKEFSDDPAVLLAQAQEEAQPEETQDLFSELEPAYEDETLRMDPVAPEETVCFVPETTDDTIPVSTAATGDTVRFSGVTGDTIRLDTAEFAKGQVRIAQPIEEPQQEAFSQDWEPEYEQPIKEYVPPQPIVFHPRSRLQELKKKLVAGPEKQYYTLSERGVGKLQAAIFFSLLVVLLSAGTTVMYALNMVAQQRMKLLVFSQFLLMLLSALLGSYQLIEGIADLYHRRFSLNTLLVFTFIACCADGILCLKQLRMPCCAAFSLQITMSLWSAYQSRNARLGQLDTMRKAIKLDSISLLPDYYNGLQGMVRGEGQVEDFMDTYDQPSGPEKVLSWYAFAALLAGIGVGITGGVLHGWSFGVRVTAVTLLASMPATIFITLTRPFAVLQRRLQRLGTVLCGWQGIKGLCQKAVFPVEHDDLFPAGSVKLNGVKFFSSREPDQTVAYATALICADGGGLVPLFNYLLESRNGIHYTPRNYRTYEGGGIGAEVNGASVLAGSLSFLSKMGVDLPEGLRVGHAVCVAVDGELCGVFAVAYEKVRSCAAGVTTLCAYRGLRPVLVSNDFMLTGGFLRSRFGSAARKMIFPADEQRQELREKQPQEGAPALLLTTKDGLAPLAYGVTGARAFRTAGVLGVVIHVLGGIVGIGMMLALAILGAEYLLTPDNLFLYELIWMIPGLLITEWTRSI